MDILEKSLFPFPHIRDQQKDMLEDAVKAISEGRSLLASAPTGIGKTAASLAPAVSYALENSKTVFFLTPKHSQHRLAIETLKKIGERHVKNISAVDIIGKQWTCLFELASGLNHSEFTYFCQSHRSNESCRFCNNVVEPKSKEISREAKKLMSRIEKKGPLHAEELFRECKDRELCAYELSTLLAAKANVIIGDYYHLFHPHVRQVLLNKTGKAMEDLIVIVDEAHNLPERVRRLMSSSLSEYTLDNSIKEAQALREKNLETDLRGLNSILLGLGKRLKGDEAFVGKQDLLDTLDSELRMPASAFVEDLETCAEKILQLPNRYRSYCSSVSSFIRDWLDQERDESAYARILNTYLSQSGKRLQLSIKCLDPALYCSEVLSRSHASILMSGTLVPPQMYENVLGLENAISRQYPNPFPPENRLVLLTHGITTKYTLRSEHMWNKMALAIAGILDSVPGNVAVFFPSYGIMETISKRVSFSSKEPLLERRDMGKAERHALYEKLRGLSENGGAALFAVQAGGFSEGMDFPGKMLDCVVVVGLPLEKPSLETGALINYYDAKFNKGWDYGYIYPAINRSLQAAGRCIRSEKDRGAIILMDDRFKQPRYRRCFPEDMKFIVTEKPDMYLKTFFKG